MKTLTRTLAVALVVALAGSALASEPPPPPPDVPPPGEDADTPPPEDGPTKEKPEDGPTKKGPSAPPPPTLPPPGTKPDGEGEGAPAPVTPSEPTPVEALRADLDGKRFGAAAFRCDELEQAGELTELPMRELCAKANLHLGDRLATVRSYKEAMARWRKAAALDPRLLDDPGYTKRLQTGRPPDPIASPPPDVPPEEPPVVEEPLDRKPPRTAEPPEPPPEEPVEPTPPEERGPRYGRIIGVGMSGGYDGIFGFMLAWMHDERLAVELSTGLLYATLDTRVKVYGFKSALTPVVGLGMITPFGDTPRFGLEIPGYADLYRLGQSFHVDIGISYAVSYLDIYAGLSFLTSLDQETADRLVFFPQFGVQLLFYFP